MSNAFAASLSLIPALCPMKFASSEPKPPPEHLLNYLPPGPEARRCRLNATLDITTSTEFFLLFLYSGVSRSFARYACRCSSVHPPEQAHIYPAQPSMHSVPLRPRDICHLTANVTDKPHCLRRLCSFSLSNIGLILSLACAGHGSGSPDSASDCPCPGW